MTDPARLERFLAFSAQVTAFTEFDLQGTGQAEPYLSAVENVVGEGLVSELLEAYGRVQADAQPDPSRLDNLLRRDIFSDPKLGPVARNIVKLWYVGIWYELPREWTEAFGAREQNFTFMVSADAYTEGLLWPAIGANPPGAKAPGYGSWAAPPQIPGVTAPR
ncbi:MAG: hypothetical protein ACLP50_37810 [Solirubrobacteraceae bacterium]